EPLTLRGAGGSRKGRDLQGTSPPQGNLLGLIDPTHSSATDLTQQTEITQLPNVGCGVVSSLALRFAFNGVLEHGGQSLHLVVAGKELLKFVPEIRMRSKELAAVRNLTRLQRFKVCTKLFIQSCLAILVFGRVVPHPSTSPRS